VISLPGVVPEVVVVEALYGLGLWHVSCLNVLLEVGIVVECHPTLFTHDILGLEVHLVDVLTKVGVFSFTVRTFCLKHIDSIIVHI